MRGNLDTGGDAFGQRSDVRDDADVFAVRAQLAQGFQRAVQGFFVQRAEAFVEKECVYLHVFAAHLGKSQREGEADDEAFAAGEVFGAAGFAALVVVDDVEFERACRVGGEQVAVAQLYQLAVCLGDDAGKCQALCVVAVFFAVRRADEFVQVLPAPGFGGLFCDGLLLGGKALAGAFVFSEAVLVCGEGLLVLLSGVFVGFLARLQGGGVGVVGALRGEAGKAGGAVLLAGVQGKGLLVQGGGLAGERFACGGGQARGLPGGFVRECCRCARGCIGVRVIAD